jgi:hypothetical protein
MTAERPRAEPDNTPAQQTGHQTPAPTRAPDGAAEHTSRSRAAAPPPAPWKPSEFRWCRDMVRPWLAHFANINRYLHTAADLAWVYSVCTWSVLPNEPEVPGQTERCPNCEDWARAHGHLNDGPSPDEQKARKRRQEQAVADLDEFLDDHGQT